MCVCICASCHIHPPFQSNNARPMYIERGQLNNGI